MTAQTLSRSVFIDLHDLLRDVDPARWRDEQAAAFRERLARVQTQLAELGQRLAENPRFAAVHGRLVEMAHALEVHAAELSHQASDARRQWMDTRAQLLTRYEALVSGLRPHAIHVPSLRPTNYARNLFHVSSALGCLLLVELVAHASIGMAGVWALRALAFGFAIWSWSMETLRRTSPELNAKLMKVFAKVSHPHEHHRVNSATWYATALALLTVVGDPVLCAMGVVVLGVGDPAAALIGRRFGRIKLVHGRSLEGTLSFLVVATLAAFPLLALVHGMSAGKAALVALGSAAAGALAELFSFRVDDNLSVPVCAAAGCALMLFLL